MTRVREQLARGAELEIYIVDGTYELLRHYYALPSARDQDGNEVAAVRGVLASVLGMIKAGATHIAVATRRTKISHSACPVPASCN
jgi:hypothetical protein